MKVSLNFYLNEDKKNNRRGIIPIYVRIRLNGKKAEGRLYHADVLEKEGLLWDERTMRLADAKHKANKLINAVQKEFDEFTILHGKHVSRHSANYIRDHLLGRNKGTVPSLLEYIDSYYKNSVEKNSTLSKGTKKSYSKAIRHFTIFLRANNKAYLLLTDTNSNLANGFKDYLLNASEDGQRNGMTEPTAAGNIMRFKTIFSRAVDDGLLEKSPFKGIKLKTRSPRKPPYNQPSQSTGRS